NDADPVRSEVSNVISDPRSSGNTMWKWRSSWSWITVTSLTLSNATKADRISAAPASQSMASVSSVPTVRVNVPSVDEDLSNSYRSCDRYSSHVSTTF